MTDRPISTPILVGAEPPKPRGFADFFDGRTARLRRVEIEIDDSDRSLVIRPPEAGEERWPLHQLREIPDQADRSRLLLTSSTRGLARLTLTDPETITMLRARQSSFDARPPVLGRGRVLGWAAAAVASVFAIVFFLVPVMADQMARILPANGERALGEATLGQIQTALGSEFFPVEFCTSPEGDAALAAMLDRVAGGALDLPYPVTVSVLDHGMVNAFALPGGQVVFFRGMLDAANGPDEIAAVLAHEIGHVAARDPTQTALRSAGSLGVLGLLFGDFAGGAAVTFLVERIIEADYSRAAEAAADDFGIELLVRANIDPAALGTLFQTLLNDFGDPEGIAKHFASHPALGNRIEGAAAAADRVALPDPSLDAVQWAALQAICTR